jgi:hypothetical protein
MVGCVAVVAVDGALRFAKAWAAPRRGGQALGPAGG